MIKKIYLAQQNESTRRWTTIAALERVNDGYHLFFTNGVSTTNSFSHELFKMDVYRTYYFRDLIPLFSNRIPSRQRLDYARMSSWLNMSGDESTFEKLAKFGLITGTDGILFYPEPNVSNGRLELEFFVHGIRHVNPAADPACQGLQVGERLKLMLDVQNAADTNAVAIRSEREAMLLGYVPAFYAYDVGSMLRSPEAKLHPVLTVARVNDDAPVQLRLLCRLTAEVGADYRPLDTPEHKQVAETG